MDVLQMSISAAILVAVIAVIRLVALNKLPKKTFWVLWGVVLLRLLIPFYIPFYVEYTQNAVGALPQTASPHFSDTRGANLFDRTDFYRPGTGAAEFYMPDSNAPVTSPETAAVVPQTAPQIPRAAVAAVVWAVGTAALALFFVVTHLRCRREYKTALPLENEFINQWLAEQKLRRSLRVLCSDKINAPLTYGLFKPVILFPKDIDLNDEDGLRFVLAHELAHVKRFDVLTKWLLAAALCVHWFNPLVWVMYVLANRDIEAACDEAVLSSAKADSRTAYALTLLRLEERKSNFLVNSPIYTNFAKNATEERIGIIMKMKKRTVLSAAAAVLVIFAVTVGALVVSARPETAAPYDLEQGTLGFTQEEFDESQMRRYYFAEEGFSFAVPNEWYRLYEIVNEEFYYGIFDYIGIYNKALRDLLGWGDRSNGLVIELRARPNEVYYELWEGSNKALGGRDRHTVLLQTDTHTYFAIVADTNYRSILNMPFLSHLNLDETLIDELAAGFEEMLEKAPMILDTFRLIDAPAPGRYEPDILTEKTPAENTPAITFEPYVHLYPVIVTMPMREPTIFYVEPGLGDSVHYVPVFEPLDRSPVDAVLAALAENGGAWDNLIGPLEAELGVTVVVAEPYFGDITMLLWESLYCYLCEGGNVTSVSFSALDWFRNYRIPPVTNPNGTFYAYERIIFSEWECDELGSHPNRFSSAGRTHIETRWFRSDNLPPEPWLFDAE